MSSRRSLIAIMTGAFLLSSVLTTGRAGATPCVRERDEPKPAECRHQTKQPRAVRVELPQHEVTDDESTVPYAIARVITDSVPVFTHPADFYAGLPPVRDLGDGYLWVSVLGSADFNGETWYLINDDEYVRADKLALNQPSTFQGVLLPEQPAAPFGWIVTWQVQPSRSPAGAANATAPALGRYTIVTLYASATVDGVLWYEIAKDQWIPQTAVGVVTVNPRPQEVRAGERWIEVDLFEQTVAAYEGERMVYATLASTGLKEWATDPGLFRMWAKLERAKMSGREGKPDYYYLEDVPWIMYFNQDMALHGAYWHDRFGYPHSHGCVNLAPLDAQWFFNWTTPLVPDTEGLDQALASEENMGTWVWVH